jgi:hypothetical protein
MGEPDKPEPDSGERKALGWRMPATLKERIAELARWKNIQIETLVEQWLEAKVTEAEIKRKAEERKQALRTLGMTENDLPKRLR